jgi:DNA-binding CsgD family transcriptional regulator
LLAEGKSSTAIARLLGVTERTIRNRRRARRDRTRNQPDLFS